MTGFLTRAVYTLAGVCLLVSCASENLLAPPPGGGDCPTPPCGDDVNTIPDIVDIGPDGGGPDESSDFALELTPLDVATPTLGGFGDPCDDDDDCESRYCIEGEEGWICTALCSDECPEGFECRFVVNTGGDAVRICLPAIDVLCEPCEVDTDCFGYGAFCLDQADGPFCATTCELDPCPENYACNPVTIAGGGGGGEDLDTELCEPVLGVCSACADEDRDGYGVGLECLGEDCDESRADVHPNAEERCNEVDDDCDDDVDEGFDLATDAENCGACGVICELPNAIAGCADGICVVVACVDGYGDCDGVAENGCETDFSLPDTCGACGEVEGVLGEACGTCGSGTFGCDGADTLACLGDLGEAALNACGGCDMLTDEPDAPCGTCGSGAFVCVTGEVTACAGDLGDAALNTCGGCGTLSDGAGEACGPCGLDLFVCTGADSTACSGSTYANGCLGCEPLAEVPGTVCGPCGLDEFICDGPEAIICDGDSRGNPCGGCAPLAEVPGTPCGTCDSGMVACDGPDSTVCEGDLGDSGATSCLEARTLRFGWSGAQGQSGQFIWRGSAISDRAARGVSAVYECSPFPVESDGPD